MILNLRLNAIDAVSSADDRAIAVIVDVDAGEAHVTVADRGPGVSDAEQARLFAPFFTTKDVGVASGLASRSVREKLSAYAEHSV